MKYGRLLITVLILTFAGSCLVAGSDLYKAAMKERARRAKLKQKRAYVFTNEDVREVKGGTVNEAESNVASTDSMRGQDGQPADLSNLTPEQQEKLAIEMKKAGRAIGEHLDRNGNGEAYWRGRMADAQGQVNELENKQKQIVTEINRLNTAFVNTDDPAQRTLRKRELDEAYAERDRLDKDLAGAKAAVAGVKNEGRKADALPGWLR